MLSFKGETLLLKEEVNMLRSRDVIYKGILSIGWAVEYTGCISAEG